jgi:hypothetical protein
MAEAAATDERCEENTQEGKKQKGGIGVAQAKETCFVA